MENMTRPAPGDVSEGCFNCGDGKDEILQSRLISGTSVALCRKCKDLPTVDRRPFNAK